MVTSLALHRRDRTQSLAPTDSFLLFGLWENHRWIRSILWNGYMTASTGQRNPLSVSFHGPTLLLCSAVSDSKWAAGLIIFVVSVATSEDLLCQGRQNGVTDFGTMDDKGSRRGCGVVPTSSLYQLLERNVQIFWHVRVSLSWGGVSCFCYNTRCSV